MSRWKLNFEPYRTAKSYALIASFEELNQIARCLRCLVISKHTTPTCDFTSSNQLHILLRTAKRLSLYIKRKQDGRENTTLSNTVRDRKLRNLIATSRSCISHSFSSTTTQESKPPINRMLKENLDSCRIQHTCDQYIEKLHF